MNSWAYEITCYLLLANYNTSMEHHKFFGFECQDDIDFQLSSTTYTSRWFIPVNVGSLLKEIRWVVQKWELGTGYV